MFKQLYSKLQGSTLDTPELMILGGLLERPTSFTGRVNKIMKMIKFKILILKKRHK